MSRWIEPWDGATHPDVGTYEDESVADAPEVERYDPTDDFDRESVIGSMDPNGAWGNPLGPRPPR